MVCLFDFPLFSLSKTKNIMDSVNTTIQVYPTLMNISESEFKHLIDQLENGFMDVLFNESINKAYMVQDLQGKVIEVYMFRFQNDAYNFLLTETATSKKGNKNQKFN